MTDNPFIDCRTRRAAEAIYRRLDPRDEIGKGLGMPLRFYEAAADALSAADGFSALPAAQESARGVETLLARVRELEHALNWNDDLIRQITHRDARWRDNELLADVLKANAALLRQNALAAGSTLDGVVL